MFETVANWFQAKEFLRYIVRAQSIRSIHSPFVFDFVQQVLHDPRTFYCYDEIEKLREQLLLVEDLIRITDHGAGSAVITSPARSIRSMARHAATPAKFAQMLFRLGVHYECKNILELGTSLGLTTLYLSSISQDAQVVTIEGDPQLAALAAKHFELLNRKNISLLTGTFESQLQTAAEKLERIDLAYIDGNHRKEATLNYFHHLLPFIHEKSVLVVGDIHWSKEMDEAWKEITSSPGTTATIDLFYLGLVFFRKELSKQQFVIRC
ncbi:MAG: class I SAM-dependent methyltransferase [Chitinophagales bacterium]|nr:class I SAM-dependent methyltransferase [Chitinophagales bacterium]